MQLRLALPALAFLALGVGAVAQLGGSYGTVRETRTALAEARAQARSASVRATRLEITARSTRAAAEKTAREAAATAARIQEAEAEIAAAQARIAMAKSERAALEKRLAKRRGPLIRLTGGLQKLARRPLALAVLRPGSLRETVYLRAMLDTTLPEVRQRTAALRGELGRAQAIEDEARSAYAALKQSERALAMRRTQLAALEARQRLASRRVGGAAAREAEKALALAEEARDLDALVDRLGAAGTLRRRLAALPGPLLRPPRPGASEVLINGPQPERASAAFAPSFQLPVAGRTVTGFGQRTESGAISNGLTLAPASGAQVVAPAAGRVAFAGPFRGFGRIVIVEHSGGFTSLVTGLARVDVSVGERLVAGAPLGIAGIGRPVVGLELRHDEEPVNPVEFLR